MKRWLRLSQFAGGESRTSSQAGYTITEVMIVLAVSALMFVAIAVTFSGRQGRVEFNQAVRDYEGRLQSIMNEVAAGYYQSDYRCTLDGAGYPSISTGVAANAGTNEDCIFVGKVVVPDAAPGTASVIETLIGRRLSLTGADVETLAEAQPVVVPTAATSFTHSFGLQVREIQNLENNDPLFGLGFINRLSRGSTPAGGDVSGGEGLIRLYGLTSQALAGPNDIVDPAQMVLLPEGAVLCLAGQNGQFAEVTIGENNSQNTIFSVLDTAESGEKCNGL